MSIQGRPRERNESPRSAKRVNYTKKDEQDKEMRGKPFSVIVAVSGYELRSRQELAHLVF